MSVGRCYRWEFSWDCWGEHIHAAFPCGFLGFFTMQFLLLSSKRIKKPWKELHCLYSQPLMSHSITSAIVMGPQIKGIIFFKGRNIKATSLNNMWKRWYELAIFGEYNKKVELHIHCCIGAASHWLMRVDFVHLFPTLHPVASHGHLEIKVLSLCKSKEWNVTDVFSSFQSPLVGKYLRACNYPYATLPLRYFHSFSNSPSSLFDFLQHKY